MLGSLVQDLVGDRGRVTVVMPNGADPHGFQPSARDVEAIAHADLVVENGLDLEEGMQDVLDRARDDGVPVFTASDHVRVRTASESSQRSHLLRMMTGWAPLSRAATKKRWMRLAL